MTTTPIDGCVFMPTLNIGPKNTDYIETDKLKKQIDTQAFQIEILTALVASIQKEKKAALLKSKKLYKQNETLTNENTALQRKLEKLGNQ